MIRITHRTVLAAATALALTGSALALAPVALARDKAADKTTAPALPRLPIQAIVQILEFEGYQDIRSIELDGTVYEVEARDKTGAPVDFEMDAVTAEIVAPNRRDDRREDRVRNERRSGHEAAPAAFHPTRAQQHAATAEAWTRMLSGAPHPAMGIGNPHRGEPRPSPVEKTGAF